MLHENLHVIVIMDDYVSIVCWETTKTKLYKQIYTPYFKSPSLLDLAGRLRDTLSA